MAGTGGNLARVEEPREVTVTPVDRASLRVQLLEWSEQPIDGVGGLAVVELRHHPTKQALGRYGFERGTTKLDELVDKIANLIERDASNLPPARHAYTLEAYYGDAHYSQALWRTTVTVTDDGDEFFGVSRGGSLERDGMRQLTRAFVTSQEQKDSLVKFFFTQAARDKHELREQTRTQWDELVEMHGKLLGVFGAFQQSLDRQQEREIKARNHAAFLQGMQELLGVGKALLPILLRHHLGENAPPVPDWAHPFVEKLQQLYQAVTRNPATMSAIFEALEKDKAALTLFGSLMSDVQDARELAAKRAELAVKAEAAIEEDKRRTAEEQAALEAEATQTAVAAAPRRTTPIDNAYAVRMRAAVTKPAAIPFPIY